CLDGSLHMRLLAWGDGYGLALGNNNASRLGESWPQRLAYHGCWGQPDVLALRICHDRRRRIIMYVLMAILVFFLLTVCGVISPRWLRMLGWFAGGYDPP